MPLTGIGHYSVAYLPTMHGKYLYNPLHVLPLNSADYQSASHRVHQSKEDLIFPSFRYNNKLHKWMGISREYFVPVELLPLLFREGAAASSQQNVLSSMKRSAADCGKHSAPDGQSN